MWSAAVLFILSLEGPPLFQSPMTATTRANQLKSFKPEGQATL
jgi:hypothetical protein